MNTQLNSHISALTVYTVIQQTRLGVGIPAQSTEVWGNSVKELLGEYTGQIAREDLGKLFKEQPEKIQDHLFEIFKV